MATDPDPVVAEDTGLVGSPWLALCPRRALELRDPDQRSLDLLPSGTAVALVTDGLMSRRRLRKRASRAGVRVDRELIVVPSTRSPIVVLDDSRAAVRHFWSSVVAAPPGVTRAHAPLTVLLLAARLAPWRWTATVAPGRVLVGIRR